MGELTKHPLSWPDNVARTAPHSRKPALFATYSVLHSTKLLLAELNRLNRRSWDYADEDVIISTNARLRLDGLPRSDEEPADPGVAVYFKLRFRRGAKEFARHTVLTCDKWTRVSWNLYSISKDVEAQRARARWGCTSVEQAFHGYLAIPERCGRPAWWITLGVSPDATVDQVKAAFLSLAKTRHPDHGGTAQGWEELRTAYEQALSKATV